MIFLNMIQQVFSVDPDCERDLPARIAQARAWLASGLTTLARAQPFPDLDYGLPVRMIAVGMLRGRMVVVVYTDRAAGRHIISMRKANDREQARYRDELG